jgi:hypothetical protein
MMDPRPGASNPNGQAAAGAVARRRLRSMTNTPELMDKSACDRAVDAMRPVRTKSPRKQTTVARPTPLGCRNERFPAKIPTPELAGPLPPSGDMPPPSKDRPASQLEIFFGRSLAMCVHPMAAWQVAGKSGRLVILAGYVTAGYLSVLMALALAA